MEQTLSIRAMEPADAEAVACLISQLGYRRSAENVRSLIVEIGRAIDRQAAFVACLDGEVVGWIEVSIQDRLQTAPFALIGGLVVSERVRRRGIGLELLRRAEAWAWERGLARVRVTSRSTREGAHHFYSLGGYRTVKTSMVFEKDRP